MEPKCQYRVKFVIYLHYLSKKVCLLSNERVFWLHDSLFFFPTRAHNNECNCSGGRCDFRVPHWVIPCFAFPEIIQTSTCGRENGLNLHWQALLAYLFIYLAWVDVRADLCPCCPPYSEAVKEQIDWAVSAGREDCWNPPLHGGSVCTAGKGHFSSAR